MFRKLMLTVGLFFAVTAWGQDKFDYASADSVTQKLYLSGDWMELIQVGKVIIAQKIEFKTLDQRIGYAYFIKKDYSQSKLFYEKALSYDKSDEISLLYLYYNALYLGNNGYARFYEGRLSPEMKAYVHSRQLRLVDAVDLEYNYKSVKTNLQSIRTPPVFKRLGINSLLGYRLNLYQAFSVYTQALSEYSNYSYATNQKEYYASLGYNLTAKWRITGAYHYLYTTLAPSSGSASSSIYAGNVFLGALNHTGQKWDWGWTSSYFKTSLHRTVQHDFEAIYHLSVHPAIQVKEKITRLSESDTIRWISTTSAGVMLAHKCWLEGRFISGDIKNYTDLNALYVYNSLDISRYKAGVGLFYYANRHLTLYTDYTCDKKQYMLTSSAFKEALQHSFTGGVIWKF